MPNDDEWVRLQAAKGRACGSCRLCCKLVGVEVLDKPPGTWCQHACSKGCGIYETRPDECRKYVCLWLAGFFEDEDRPDRTRVLPSLHGTEESPYFVLYEALPGASDRGRGKKIFTALWQTGVATAVKRTGTDEGTLHTRVGTAAARSVSEMKDGDIAKVSFGPIDEETFERVRALRKRV